jgi:hypothetical protein
MGHNLGNSDPGSSIIGGVTGSAGGEQRAGYEGQNKSRNNFAYHVLLLVLLCVVTFWMIK